MSLWYTGSRPARVTVAFQDGAEVGVNPGGSINQQGIYLIQYAPGNEFYPWRSTSGDRAVWMRIAGHAGEGRVVIHGTTTATGHFDLYGSLDNVISFSDHLVLGRLTDYATTRSAIVAGAHVVRTAYVDLNGHSRILDDEGAAAELWLHSSAGPTRDGRLHGVDVSAPGHNCFAAYAAGSYWRTFEFNLIHDGGGWYGRAGATSGSAPIVVGAVALMLERKPMLTAAEIREVLRETARADDHTGSVPNADWGYGKLDILRALDAVCPDQDFDCDGDRDLEDAYVLMRCMNGPDNGEPPMLCPQAYFHRSDSDGDQDADLMDYADFQRRTGIPAP